MSDPEYKEDEVKETKSEETTPAGSYRLPGQDVSGFLGVDSEYMNSAGPGGEAILTEEEAYLFLPAPDEDEEDVDDETDEESDEAADAAKSESDHDDADAKMREAEAEYAKQSEQPADDQRVQVNPTRPVL